MVTVDQEVEIARPVMAVWDRIADFERAPEWQASLVEVTLDGPNGPGARAREVRRFGEQVIETMGELTVWDPPSHLRAEAGTPWIRSAVDYRLEATSTGCHVQVHLELTGLPSVLEPDVQAQTSTGFAEDLARLRDLLEAEPPSN